MNMRAWINAVIAKCLWLAQQLYSGSLPQMSTFSLHWLSTSLTPKQSQRLYIYSDQRVAEGHAS